MLINSTPNIIKIYNASAGSGKTFTLVKEYLKVLLSSSDPYQFQQILALTFTNKATAEMKDRIIESLHQFSTSKETAMFLMIHEELNLPKNLLFERSREILSAILQRYSAFKVTTIDSFNHQLIRAFSYDLGISLTAEIELDTKKLLEEAVDLLMADIGNDPELTKTLVSFAVSKLHQDKSWDISLTLKKRAAIILNETDAPYIAKIKQMSLDELRKVAVNLVKKNRSIEQQFVQIGTEGLLLIESKQLFHNDFSFGDLPKFFVKLTHFSELTFDELKFEGRLHKNITSGAKLHPKRLDEQSAVIVEQIAPQLRESYYKAQKLYIDKYETYLLNQLIVDNMMPMAVMQQVNKYLQKIKKDQNLILNAEFNKIISQSINSQPVAFIYERIGEKFSHFFIDEMQDTSQLQWQNLFPLIENTLVSQSSDEQGSMLLMVGDAKQSIYRWRGGNATQFIELSDATQKLFNLEKEVQNLQTNYRSFSEIIHFNNHFFTYLSNFFGNKNYKKLYVEGNNQLVNQREGGYVQLKFLPKASTQEEQETRFPEEVYQTILGLDKAYKKSEVCILVRTQKNGVEVANYLNKQGIEVISSETLLIDNNPKVAFILNTLRAIQNPNDLNSKIQMCYFLHNHLSIKEPKHDFYVKMMKNAAIVFFEELKSYGIDFHVTTFVKKQLYDATAYLIKSFDLIDDQTDAYVQFFLDEVIGFTQKKPTNLSEFLAYWEENKHKLSIVSPENEHAVRIMTIHKAKGLEFPVVISPYNTHIYKQIDPTIWYRTNLVPNSEHVLIPFGKQLNYLGMQGAKLFEERREELELDSYNVLYVALTRAVEQLYVITDHIAPNKLKEYNTTASVFAKYLEEMRFWSDDKDTYSFGNPQRPLVEKSMPKTHFKTQLSFTNNLNQQLISTLVSEEAIRWETAQEDARDFGNLVHEIMLKIQSNKDVNSVLNAKRLGGEINVAAYEKLKKMIDTVVSHPKIAHLFDEQNQVLNERKMINQHQEVLIPDRVVLKNGMANIIDYKTGKPNDSHQAQVKQYAMALKEIGYAVEQNVLVYFKENMEVVCVEVET